MFSIIEHIEYLVSHHDCVVVPGWGAFIANYSAASCTGDNAGLLRHPRREIVFNASVTHNDGLLAHSLVRREGMTFDAAMRFIGDSVATYRQQLSTGGEVSMGRLGYFASSKGRYVEFVPIDLDKTPSDYYGLADLEVKMVSQLESELAQQSSQEQRDIVAPVGRNLFSRRATRIAASVAVLIGLSVMLTTPILVDRGHDKASMVPTVTAPQAQQLPPTVESDVVNAGITRVDAYPGLSRVGNTAGKFRMVIATLRNQQEMDAFKSAYADLVPYMKVLDYKGMKCVYVASSDDYAQLMSLRDELPERLRDVWIYN